jgi:hypothetical protein
VGYEPDAVVFFWHEQKLVVFVDFDSEPPREPLVPRPAPGSPVVTSEKETGMASQSTTTTDHDEIRRWVEEHDGKPASVRGTESGGDGAGVLRIDFPGGAGEDQLEHISWDDWFRKFDGNNLAFLYQQEKASGEDSTFFKLVSRDST